MEEIYLHHEPINKFFGTGYAVKFQFKDSKIAGDVVLQILRGPCIPVHATESQSLGFHKQRARFVQGYNLGSQLEGTKSPVKQGAERTGGFIRNPKNKGFRLNPLFR
tara:strand:+ start:480 stop:800 length:321 start_codon:yes stop_codon:yes gene_type:complete